jgi:hypothetical protein
MTEAKAMKMLLIICPADCAEGVTGLLEEQGVLGWSEVSGVEGSGKSGRHRGTRAFPGIGSLIFTAVPQEQADRLTEMLEGFAERCSPGEHLHLFQLEALQRV